MFGRNASEKFIVSIRVLLLGLGGSQPGGSLSEASPADMSLPFGRE
jgi:hypothetical protein